MKEPKIVLKANLPTPIEELSFNGTSFYMKRDDFTGSEYSGNKIRKLEYLLADAIRKKADYVFTCGGAQSNHARATAFAAASLGMKSKLFLRGKDKALAEGNMFLDKMVGAELKFISAKDYSEARNDIMVAEAKKLKKKGKKVYIIPEGGSNAMGVWGYINCVQEIAEQIDLKSFKGILSACGSGGTSAGLLVGAALLGLKLKVYAVNVCDDEEYFRKRIIELAEECIKNYKLDCKLDPKKLVIIDGYSKEGYTNISKDKVKVISSLAKQTGVLLDPTYTGKAFCAYNDHFLKGKKKSKVMFIHTGGLFGAFAHRKEYLAG
ncbi:MAG: pyridoxal-phosphate dependent enzyme [Melioribacteraceae bacterium]|nr:pyridoxal-phosphate dependent enzyme [Melioribacteraceae bacterium]